MNINKIYQYDDPVFYEEILDFITNVSEVMNLEVDWDETNKYLKNLDFKTINRIHIIRDKFNENRFILLDDAWSDSELIDVCVRCSGDEYKKIEKIYIDIYNDYIKTYYSERPLKTHMENLYNTPKDRYKNILKEFNIEKL